MVIPENSIVTMGKTIEQIYFFEKTDELNYVQLLFQIFKEA